MISSVTTLFNDCINQHSIPTLLLRTVYYSLMRDGKALVGGKLNTERGWVSEKGF